MEGINYAGLWNQFKRGRIRIGLTNSQRKRILVENGMNPKDYHGTNDLREVMAFLGYKGHK